MSSTAIWIVICVLGVGTYLLRLSFIQIAGYMSLPAPVTRALRYAPPAVLSAIILPALLQGPSVDTLNLSLANPHLLAGVLAAATAWLTRSMLAPLVVGMGALWLLQWLLG